MADDKSKVIPSAESAITRADLGPPADLTSASLGALLKSLKGGTQLYEGLGPSSFRSI